MATQKNTHLKLAVLKNKQRPKGQNHRKNLKSTKYTVKKLTVLQGLHLSP